MNIQNQNVRCSHLRKLVHRYCDLLLLNHSTDRHPALLIKLCYRGRSLAGGDLGGLAELASGNVVLAKNKSLGSDNTSDSGGNELNQLWLVRGFRLDQDGGGLHDCIYCLQASGLHRLSGLWNIFWLASRASSIHDPRADLEMEEV